MCSYFSEPACEKGFDGLPINCGIHHSSHLPMECFQLIGHFLARFPVDVFAFPFAVRAPTEISNRTPKAICPLVNAAFAVTSTLAHRQPPVYARVHAPSLRVAFHPRTVGLCCEVLPGGTKWGVIWLPYSKICMRSHACEQAWLRISARHRFANRAITLDPALTD